MVDMLSLEILNSDTGNLAVRMSCDDLTLQIDRENYKRTAYSVDDIRMPPSWSFDHFQDKCSPNDSDERTLKRREIPNTDKKYTIFPDISEIQGHLYGWMRTSMFPRFRKLYAKSLQTSLLPGTYTIIIQSSNAFEYYRVDEIFYDILDLEAHKMMARKTIVLANASSFGGRSYFLGIIYLVLGKKESQPFYSLIYMIFRLPTINRWDNFFGIKCDSSSEKHETIT